MDQPQGEEDAVTAALRRLVAEIAAGDFRDRNGVGLTNNIAYLEAVALLNLTDLLER